MMIIAKNGKFLLGVPKSCSLQLYFMESIHELKTPFRDWTSDLLLASIVTLIGHEGPVVDLEFLDDACPIYGQIVSSDLSKVLGEEFPARRCLIPQPPIENTRGNFRAAVHDKGH